MIDTVFLGSGLGGSDFFINSGKFFSTRESTLRMTGRSLSFLRPPAKYVHWASNSTLDRPVACQMTKLEQIKARK